MVGHGGSSAGSYLADPTSTIPSHCASIVVTSTSRVNIESRADKFSNGLPMWLNQAAPGEVGIYIRSYQNLTLKVLVATIDAQWEGMGDVGTSRHYFPHARP